MRRPALRLQRGHSARRRVAALLAAAALLIAVGCSGSPVAPTPREQPVWALSGQSNAVFLEPALRRHATVVGAAWSGAPLSWWAPEGFMWHQLAPTLSRDVSRFIWFQGESDADVGRTPGAPLTSTYVERLRDLVARVRQRTRSNVFVMVCGLTNAPDYQVQFDAIRAEQQRFVATDPNAVYVSTLDLPSDGRQHLTEQGYAMLAARIAAMAQRRDDQ